MWGVGRRGRAEGAAGGQILASGTAGGGSYHRLKRVARRGEGHAAGGGVAGRRGHAEGAGLAKGLLRDEGGSVGLDADVRIFMCARERNYGIEI